MILRPLPLPRILLLAATPAFAAGAALSIPAASISAFAAPAATNPAATNPAATAPASTNPPPANPAATNTPASTKPAPTTPAPGPLRIVGSPANGCLAGAERLPESGPGFQTIHLTRSAFWGAPQTIARIELLAREAHQAGIGDLYVEDIARPRGGRLPGGHTSHQLGLDADIGLDVQPKSAATDRELVELPSLVRADQRGIDPASWSPAVVTLLRLAAALPEVDRILVNPAIKRQLCDTVAGERAWLRLIRPWYGHAAHMHIRFRCPADQPACAQAPPPPPGDGCDATLQWWFDRLDQPEARVPATPSAPPSPPASCIAIMAAPPG